MFYRVSAPACIPTSSAKEILSPHPRLHLFLPELLMLITVTGVRWYLFVVLICISPMMSDGEHFFMFNIWMSSLEKCRFVSFAHFFTGLFVFWVLSLISSFFLTFIYFLRERDRVRAREEQREEDTESKAGSRLRAELSAQSLTWGSNSQPDHDLSQSWRLN